MLKHLTDLELINLVKESESSEAMTEIITRHSGIFIEIINHYVPCNSPYCDRKEMIEDKKFYIYQALLKYDPDRGTKFSTHLGNEAKWLCLNSYNKAKNKLMLPSSDIQYDVDPSIDPQKDATRQESFRKILEIIDKYPDERVQKIFNMRYIEGSKNRVMPWKHISHELDMSIQGCINIHNAAIKNIKKKVMKEC